MDVKNTKLLLAHRPDGMPQPEDWELVVDEVPSPGRGEVLVHNRYVSIDPAMRGWMRGGPSYLGPLGLRDVMHAWTVGNVVSSVDPRFAAGDVVTGALGVQDYALSSGAGLRHVDLSLGPAPSHLGLLGMTGVTAHMALHRVAGARPGDTVLVSAASGAVGTVAGQLARRHGCRVVGITGGERKARFLVEELGFDAAVDRHLPDLDGQLCAALPSGADVYLDNVGGPVLRAALEQLADHARVVLCGAISRYNGPVADPGIDLLPVLVHRCRIEGFLVLEMPEHYDAVVRELAALRASGAMREVQDTVRGGVGDFPATLTRLFTGEHTGKLLLALD